MDLKREFKKIDSKRKQEAVTKKEQESFADLTEAYPQVTVQKIKDYMRPTADRVIVQPSVKTKTKTGLFLNEPRVSPVVEILAVGPDCKVLKQGDKAILNFAAIGSIAMYQTQIDGKLFVILMESQIMCAYSGTTLEEEDLPDMPELKPDGDLAVQEEKINTEGRLN